jgi:hypothetical protein
MPDNKSITGKGDRSRIDVNDPNELAYWTKALNVSADKLKALVKEVGPIATKVRERLGGGGVGNG